MDNVKRPLPTRSLFPAASSGVRVLRHAAQALFGAARLLPARDELLLPWIALMRRPRLAFPAVLVLFALAGIVTALGSGSRVATPIRPFHRPSDLGRRLLPGLPTWNPRHALVDPGAHHARPGVALAAVGASSWVRAAIGLPEREIGAPLAAYDPPAVWFRWLCVSLMLGALALLPVVVIAAQEHGGEGDADVTAPGAWIRWRLAVAPFALAPPAGGASPGGSWPRPWHSRPHKSLLRRRPSCTWSPA
jgi:hypothetical protein